MLAAPTLAPEARLRASDLDPATRAMLARVLGGFAPPERIDLAVWAEKYRRLGSGARPGLFRLDRTPYLRGPMDALHEPGVRRIVCMKSAQVGWTDGFISNLLGYHMDIRPTSVVVMFPREQSFIEYRNEKFDPMLAATERLAGKVVTAKRSSENTRSYVAFPGGFVKFVASNSPAGVKSTSAQVALVEEPDDCNQNVKGQGDAIKLIEERTKTFDDAIIVLGGTPTVAGLSTIEHEYAASDRRVYLVPCHACDAVHELAWENVIWQRDPDRRHAVYGTALPETAAYACPECGTLWSDAERAENVRRAAAHPRGGWHATAECRGVAGFRVNELYSLFPASRLARQVEKYLTAQHEYEQGKAEALIAFTNSTLGLPWEHKSNLPDADALAKRAEPYTPWVVPAGGVVLTVGIDVQHDRLELRMDAWGRGEESWLVGYAVLRGTTTDKQDPVWSELTERVFGPVEHASGAQLVCQAAHIDASDGQTNDAVYAWVRANQHRGARAVKGSSDRNLDREIFTRPRDVDMRTETKASRYDLKVYMVGTHKAKDLIASRLQLAGVGPGRMHWYDAGERFFAGMTSEIRAPSRTRRNVETWQKKAGIANEAWDCTVYSVHAARRLRLHMWTEAKWAEAEQLLVQPSLFDAAPTPSGPAADQPRLVEQLQPSNHGFGSEEWSL